MALISTLLHADSQNADVDYWNPLFNEALPDTGYFLTSGGGILYLTLADSPSEEGENQISISAGTLAEDRGEYIGFDSRRLEEIDFIEVGYYTDLGDLVPGSYRKTYVTGESVADKRAVFIESVKFVTKFDKK